MPNDLRERIEELNVASGGGLMIVSSPPGNGATSTLYSLLRRHDAFMKQLESLEIRPAVDLENVTQHRYKGKADLPGELAKALRRDPDILMIDECETPEAAGMIVQAVTDPAGAKKVLLGSVASSSFQALAKWVQVLGDLRQAGVKVLTAVTCQVLLRKLCPNCKEEYTPSQERLAKLNLTGKKIDKFYRPPKEPLTDEKGRPMTCPTCRGTGYFGRTAAFELLEVTDAVRELAGAASPSLDQIKTACRKNKMLYLQEQALRKVIEGLTSIEEVVRVFKPKK
jgi:type II secretory ATPase GspE/PulE/Tfp pilus assembly ATPase PilB-like protein